MSLKLIATLAIIGFSSVALAHGQHEDYQDLPPPPKMETAEETAPAAVATEAPAAVKVETAQPQTDAPKLQ